MPLNFRLPELAPDAAMFASAIVVLVTFVLAARSLLAWRALGSARRRAGQLEVGLVAGEIDPVEALNRVRGRARDVNEQIEKGLWALPRLDARVDSLRASLADDRQLLEGALHDDAAALRGTFERIRGTLRLLHNARELGRTIWG